MTMPIGGMTPAVPVIAPQVIDGEQEEVSDAEAEEAWVVGDNILGDPDPAAQADSDGTPIGAADVDADRARTGADPE
jgi:hypothetical protein